MACGGIYPIAQHFSRALLVGDRGNPSYRCMTCHGEVDEDLDLFVNEFDSFLHRLCLGAFLSSPDGALVIEHGHTILVLEADPAMLVKRARWAGLG